MTEKTTKDIFHWVITLKTKKQLIGYNTEINESNELVIHEENIVTFIPMDNVDYYTVQNLSRTAREKKAEK